MPERRSPPDSRPPRWRLGDLGIRDAVVRPAPGHPATLAGSFVLPSGASQGKPRFYLVRLHFRIALEGFGPGARARVDAETDGAAAAEIDFGTVRRAARRVTIRTDVGVVTGHRTVSSTGKIAIVRTQLVGAARAGRIVTLRVWLKNVGGQVATNIRTGYIVVGNVAAAFGPHSVLVRSLPRDAAVATTFELRLLRPGSGQIALSGGCNENTFARLVDLHVR